MDFHSMKRKQLQALCKKHSIPANLSNLQMAKRLTDFLQESGNSAVQEQEVESSDVDVGGKGKKVQFSPENEVFEFSNSPEVNRRSRRNAVNSRKSKSSLVIIEAGDMNKETVIGRGSIKQTAELKLVENERMQKKRVKKAVKLTDGQTVASAVASFDNGELEEVDVIKSGRVLRSRGKMTAKGVKNACERDTKRANGDGAGVEKASDNVKDGEHFEEIVNNPSRVTRSRAHKLTEAPPVEEKRGRKLVSNTGRVAAVRVQTDDNRESIPHFLSKRGDEGDRKSATGSEERMEGNGEGLKEILVHQQIAGENVSIEPQHLLGRSKRKASMVEKSERYPCRRAAPNTEEPIQKMESRRSNRRKTMIQSVDLIGDTQKRSPLRSSVPQSDIVSEVPEDDKMTIQKMEPRRSNRRKTMIQSADLIGDTEKRYPLRSSVPQSDIVSEVPEDDKKIIQPTGVTRRSRRKTLSVQFFNANDTDSAVENLEAEEEHISESSLVEVNDAVQRNTRSRKNTTKCGSEVKIDVDSHIHQKNKVMKRKRGRVLGEDNNVLHASLHQETSGIRELMILDVQLPLSKDSESADNLSANDVISDVELTVIKEDNAGNTDSSCMNLTSGEDLANPDTDAASKTAEHEPNSPVSNDQNSTSNILQVEQGKFLLDNNVNELTEQNITDMDKNDPAVKVYSQIEDFGCNNKINDQVLAEGLNFSGEECSSVLRSSAESFLLADQTNVETDLKAADTEMIDHHRDLDHLDASINILDNKNEDTSKSSGDDGAFESCSMTRHHGDNVVEGDNTFFHKDRASELAEADEDGRPKDDKNASNHFSEINMPDRSNGERDARVVSADRGIAPDEYSIMNSNEHCEEFQAAAPFAICTDSTGVNLNTGHEDAQMTEKVDSFIYEGINSDVAETHENEFCKDHKRKCHEDGEFNLAKLFDEEERDGIAPQQKEVFSGEQSIEDFAAQGMPHGSPSIAPTTMYINARCHEANFSAEEGETYNFKNKLSELTISDESGCLKSHKILNSQETNPSTPFSASETKEKQKSLFAKSNVASTNHRQGAWSKASEPAGNVVCFLKNSEGKISQVLEGLSTGPTGEDFNHANYDIDKEASNETSIPDIKSFPVSKIAAESLGNVKFQDPVGIEHQYNNLLACQMELDARDEATHASSRQSWTETELQNLFGTLDEDAPPELGDTFCQASETANMTMSNNKLTVSNSGSSTKKLEKELEVENSNEGPRTENKNVAGYDGDIYENGIQFLFATPVKTEETYSHNRVLDGSFTSIKEDSNTIKENDATDSTSKEKAQNTGYEIENNLSIGALLSDNDVGDDICKEINEVESFQLLNTTTRVPSEAEYECCETFEDQVTQNKDEWLQETHSVIEEREEHVIPLAQSCLNEEETEKNNISACGSPQGLYEGESCDYMLETCRCKSKSHINSEGEMAQSTKVELPDADLQKSEVPENSHLLSGCSFDSNLLKETLTEISCDPEVGKIGSSKKDVAEKGISPFHLLKASSDCQDIISESGDQYEAKKLDKKNGNPEFSQDMFDELHTNSEVVVEESFYEVCQELDQLPSSDELESTGKGTKGMETTQILYETDATAEHGSLVCEVVSGDLSGMTMHVSLGCHGNDDQDLEAGGPISNLDNGKVQDAGFELRNSLCIGDLLSDDGGEDTCGKTNKVESVAVVVKSTAVISETEYDGWEASDEQFTENVAECQKETDFMTEDNEENVKSLGLSSLCKEEADNESESTEKNSDSFSGTPNNLDKLDGCQGMFIDTAMAGNLSCKRTIDHISEHETRSSDAADELSDADLQRCNISRNSQNIMDESTYSSKASHVYDELTQCTGTDELNGAKICDEWQGNRKVAILKSHSDRYKQSEEVGLACGLELDSMLMETKEKCTTTLDPNIVAPVYDELIQSTCIDDLNETKICDQSQSNSKMAILKSHSLSDNQSEAVGLACGLELDSMLMETKEKCMTVVDPTIVAPVNDELKQITDTDDLDGANICDQSQSNSKMAILKSHSISDNQSDAVGLASSFEHGSMLMETKETCMTTLDPNNIVAPAENNSFASGAVSSILCSSEMHLHLQAEHNYNEDSDEGKPVFNLNADDDEKGTEKAEESPSAQIVQFPIQELNFEENVQDSKNHAHTISNSPISGVKDILNESDVAIKDYIDSDALARIDENIACANPDLTIYENENTVPTPTMNMMCQSDSKDEDNVPSADCIDSEAQEVVGLLDEGTTVKLESKKRMESEDGQSSPSTMRKKARTILIHGTPGKKHLATSNMKENMAIHKSSDVGDITAARPAKRRALQDLRWK